MDGGFHFIDIILFAMIAIFLVLRLRSVLGRRDGTDGTHQDPFRRNQDRDERDRDERDERDEHEDNVVRLPDRSDTGYEPQAETEAGRWESADAEHPELAAGLTQIKVADPNFDERGFLAGAKIAFEMVLDAFGKGDRRSLKSLLSRDVFADFDAAIKEREDAGETVDNTLIGFKEAIILEAGMEASTAVVTVKFVTEQVNLVRDQENHVIDGDPGTVSTVTDIWTFAHDTRSRDPNWTLVATSVPE